MTFIIDVDSLIYSYFVNITQLHLLIKAVRVLLYITVLFYLTSFYLLEAVKLIVYFRPEKRVSETYPEANTFSISRCFY